MQYENRSPDTLSYIWIHLWPNAYSHNTTALGKQLLSQRTLSFHEATPMERGFINQLDFKSNDVKLKTQNHPQHSDIIKVFLNAPLLPGKAVEITTPFFVKMPLASFSRLGYLGNDFAATQWFPKAAVYDPKGWHPMAYLNYGEFYSNFGNYRVSITVPSNYQVAATGILTGPQEAIEKRNALVSGSGELKNEPDSLTRRFVFKADSVIDFAWFASPDFQVRKQEVVLPASGRTVQIWVYYNRNLASEWRKVASYLEKSVLFLSSKLGDYPYPQISAVAGPISAGGGMEYPMITVADGNIKGRDLERLIVHEAFHNWCYGILATNERTHPWMDEGMTTFYETLYMEHFYPGMSYFGQLNNASRVIKNLGVDEIDNKKFHELAWLAMARLGAHQAIDLPSEDFSLMNYGVSTYFRASLNLFYLRDFLGKDVFDMGMKHYYEQWKFRHPYPEDFQAVMEEVSGKELLWFFNEFQKSAKPVDYAFRSLNNSKGDSLVVKVRNKGGQPVPFGISGVNHGMEQKTVWYDGFKGRRKLKFPKGDYQWLVIDAPSHMPEINRGNNVIRPDGFLKKRKPLELNFLFKPENPFVRQVYWVPVMGYNRYDGYMLGALLTNQVFPPRAFEFYATPMLGFRSWDIAGNVNMYYNFFPSSGIIRNVRTGIRSSRYSIGSFEENMHFEKLQPIMEIRFRPSNANSFISQKLSFRTTFIWMDDVFSANQKKKQYQLYDLSYELKNRNPFHPSDYKLHFEFAESMVKSFFDARWFIPMHSKNKKGLDIRFFAGKFLLQNYSGPIDYRFRLSGHRGMHDYAFDGYYAARFERPGTFGGNQLNQADGFFKFPTPVGQSWDWLVAANFKYALPGKLPIGFYFDLGTYANAATEFFGSQKLPYVAGVQLILIPKILEVNFPLLYSKDLKEAKNLAGYKYVQLINWSFHLDALNPVTSLRNYDFNR